MLGGALQVSGALRPAGILVCRSPGARSKCRLIALAGLGRAGGLVELDSVRSGGPAEGGPATGQVEVVEQQEGGLFLAEPVDGRSRRR